MGVLPVSRPNALARAASVWFGFSVLRLGRWNFPLAEQREGARSDGGEGGKVKIGAERVKSVTQTSRVTQGGLGKTTVVKEST